MDLTTFDVTDHPGRRSPAPGWSCIGPHRRRTTSPRAAGTNGYEVLTSLGRRFHRVYRPA